MPGRGGTPNIVASATSAQPVELIEIIQNGHVVASETVEAAGRSATLTVALRIVESSWIAAPSYLFTILEGGLAYLGTLAAWRDEVQRQHHRAVFLSGRAARLHHHPHAQPRWHTHGG